MTVHEYYGQILIMLGDAEQMEEQRREADRMARAKSKRKK